ncbi:MAG TPA: AAA family ATPase [Burkholderiales bacterium]|nr:AAA family ATPase [Burkholderiales bacterium]
MSLYLDHFGLREPPFRITPHTDFFFDGADRGATLDALLYATLHEEGIVKVVGEVGSGKTMLCRVLIERLPAQVETVYLANPSFSRDEILVAVAEELKIDFARERVTGALHALQDRLIESYAKGRRTVILIDEAHAMPEETLEQVRLLSNLETSRHKLLQIVLFGQPELDEVLAAASMRQLKDRITHSFRMRPLTMAEVATYLTFRMRAAGYKGPDVFDPQAVARIARASGGLTRRINILADKALLAAFSGSTHAVGAKQARAAIADSEFALHARKRGSLAGLVAAAAAGALASAGAYWLLTQTSPAPAPALASAPATAPTSAPAVALAPASPAVLASTAAPRSPVSRLEREQVLRLSDYDARRNALLFARLEATREKLDTVPDERHSLELYITDNSDAARVERFLLRARDLVPLENLWIVPVASGGRYRIWALYGDFPGRDEAVQAARRLPPKYQEAFPLVPRSFAEVRRPL